MTDAPKPWPRRMAGPLVAPIRDGLRQIRSARRGKQTRKRKADIHAPLIAALAHKDTLKIGFVVLHDSAWKLQPLLNRIKDTDGLTAFVLVPQITTGDPILAAETQVQTLAFFTQQPNAPQVSTDVADFAAFDADVVFMTNPHPLVDDCAYTDLFTSKLCCYVPYTADVVQYGNDKPQYNQPFHRWMWRIFAPHEVSLQKYQKVCDVGAEHVVVTGYPGFESLRDGAATPSRPPKPVWKPQDRAKAKIIWAPHHSVNRADLPLSNFLTYSAHFQELAERHKDQLQWAFKPHPVLKSALSDPQVWGPAKTVHYYAFWRDQANTQLEEGPYTDLFLQSDAMIHDSVSFLAEYHVTGRPVLYLDRDGHARSFLNGFGQRAYEASKIGQDSSDIDRFIAAVVAGTEAQTTQAQDFVTTAIIGLSQPLPTDRILSELLTLTPKLAARINRQT